MTRMRRPLTLLLGTAAFFLVAGGFDLRPASVLDRGLAVTEAEAILGRPLTPVSVAGVARRTTRRVMRRTAYYVAALPPGCIYPTPYGAYYQCGSTYYEQVGNQYVVIVIE